MLVKYTVSEFLSAKGSFSSIDICIFTVTRFAVYSLNLYPAEYQVALLPFFKKDGRSAMAQW